MAAAYGNASPSADSQTASAFPTGVDSYKIEVSGEGIYEISKGELVAAGFPSGDSLTSYVLTNRGQTIAYQYIASGEKIRFYAGPFGGSWEDKQHIDHEVFWLWPGTPALIADPGSAKTGSNNITTYRATVKHEHDDVYSSTKILKVIWDDNNLDPDSMYWTELVRSGSSTVTTTLPITLPHHLPGGTNSTFNFMIAVEGKGTASIGDGNAKIQVNDYSQTLSQYILGNNGANGTPFLLTQSVPASELGVNNTAEFTHSPGTFSASNILLINYIEVEYDSDLAADQDQVVFTHPGSGSFDFRIGSFSTTDKDEVTFWNITNPAAPVAHRVREYTSSRHRIGVTNQTGTATYVAAADVALRSAQAISKYNGQNLTPAGGSADWIAITHPDFLAAANSLAAHRASFSRLKTHVVTAEDVINQYGYGYPTPAAIKAFIQNAYDTWPVKPQYVVLIGDANLNPRQLPCTQCNEAGADWQTPHESFLPFNYAFEDRFLGLVPSDHAYTLLAGGDLLPDIAIGRLSVETAVEANDAVAKIVTYENGLNSPQSWHEDILFVHDYNKNLGDNFVGDINNTLPLIPASFDTEIIGMNVQSDALSVLSQVNDAVNTGVSIMNYRGHGSMTTWSHGAFITSAKVKADLFNNLDRPMVSISLDCLDGHFGYPGIDSLSETLLRKEDRGSAAHWSSTGLGFAYEHNVLSRHFYDGLFNWGHSALGDAINHAKIQYHAGGYDESEMFAFLLQGDPAMQLYLPSLTFTHETPFLGIKAQESGTIDLVATNSSPFTSSMQTVMTYTLPISLSLNTVTGSGVTYSTSTNGQGQTVISMQLNNGVPGSGEAVVSVNATAAAGVPATTVSSPAALFVPGSEKTQDVFVRLRNESASDVFLPITAR